MNTKSKLFAIRRGDFVEFRRALKSPKMCVTTVTVTRNKKIPKGVFYNYATGAVERFPERTVESKSTLKNVCFVGGVSVGACRFSRFSRLSEPKVKLAKYGVIETTRNVVRKCS